MSTEEETEELSQELDASDDESVMPRVYAGSSKRRFILDDADDLVNNKSKRRVILDDADNLVNNKSNRRVILDDADDLVNNQCSDPTDLLVLPSMLIVSRSIQEEHYKNYQEWFYLLFEHPVITMLQTVDSEDLRSLQAEIVSSEQWKVNTYLVKLYLQVLQRLSQNSFGDAANPVKYAAYNEFIEPFINTGV